MPQNNWQDLAWAQRYALVVQRPHPCDPTAQWAIEMQGSRHGYGSGPLPTSVPTADDAHTGSGTDTAPPHGTLPTDTITAPLNVNVVGRGSTGTNNSNYTCGGPRPRRCISFPPSTTGGRRMCSSSLPTDPHCGTTTCCSSNRFGDALAALARVLALT